MEQLEQNVFTKTEVSVCTDQGSSGSLDRSVSSRTHQCQENCTQYPQCLFAPISFGNAFRKWHMNDTGSWDSDETHWWFLSPTACTCATGDGTGQLGRLFVVGRDVQLSQRSRC